MVKCKLISPSELKDLLKFHKKYVNEKFSYKKLKEYYKLFPKLFVGCYDEEELIGYCFPGVINNEIYIEGIAVNDKYWGRGIGSKVLDFFLKQAKNNGITRMTVPSADIESVERFYIKNGFKPLEYLIIVKKKNFDKIKSSKYKILNKREEGNNVIFYIKARKYDPKLRKHLKQLFNAESVEYIFYKNL